MKKIFFIIFFPFPFLYATSTAHILSDEAYFDGKDIFFSGNVKISSSMGHMLSEKAIITDFKNEKKDFSFLLLLEEKVKTHLLPNINIKSDAAKILFPEKSFFSLDEENPTLLTTIMDNNHSLSLLKATCQKMEFDFDEKSKNYHYMKKFQLEENVAIDFNNDWKLSAHKVSFSPNKEDKDILFIETKNQKELCKISYLNNYLFCTSGEIDLQEKELFFENAKGNISSLNFYESKNINFSCKKLFYDHLSHKLLVKEKVHIELPTLALIETDELQFYENQRLPQKELKKICMLGNSLIQFYDISDKMTSNLTCDGSLIIDNELKTISAKSSHQSKTLFPIIYSNDKLTVHTQKAYLQYDLHKNHYFPTQLELNEGVHFFTKSYPEKNSYGMADSALLYPQEKLLRLIANKEKRVFFWQEDDALKLSAPEIQIRQMKDKSEFIKGVGDVRFSFNFDEQKFLSEFFFKPVDTQ